MSAVITGRIAEAVMSTAEKHGFTPEEYIRHENLGGFGSRNRIAVYVELFKKYLLEARSILMRGTFPRPARSTGGRDLPIEYSG